MVFRVNVMPRAIEDITDYADFIFEDSPSRSQAWLLGVWDTIFSLQEMPERYAVIAESEQIGADVRDVGFQSHRIVFEVERESMTVNVLRVYGMAQSSIESSDLL